MAVLVIAVAWVIMADQVIMVDPVMGTGIVQLLEVIFFSVVIGMAVTVILMVDIGTHMAGMDISAEDIIAADMAISVVAIEEGAGDIINKIVISGINYKRKVDGGLV